MGEQKRGLSKDCIEKFESFINSGLKEKLENDKELFLGIRDNYVNIYYNCCSIARWEYRKKGNGVIKIHKKYLSGGKTESKYACIESEEFLTKYAGIIKNAEDVSTGKLSDKTTREKIAQQALVLNNNLNRESCWYCTDIEYTQSEMDNGTPGFGRFDIVAISRKPENGKYKIALIELKVGSDAFSSSIKTDYKDKSKNEDSLKAIDDIEKGRFNIAEYKWSLGSGILGHFADFYRFMKQGQFNQLREETCNIINNKNTMADLIGKTPFDNIELKAEDISEIPEYHFVLICGTEEKQVVQDTFKRYLHNSYLDGKRPSKYSVEKVFGQSDAWADLQKYSIFVHYNDKQADEIKNLMGDAGNCIWPGKN